MSMVMNFAPLVEMVLLTRSFTASMSAFGVPKSPGKLIRLPPTVRHMRYVYDCFGQ